MVEQILDLIRALTTATISRELKWVLVEEYIDLGPDRMRACGYDVTRMKREYEGVKPNARDSKYEATWLDRSLKIYREPSDSTIHLVIESPEVRLKLSNELAGFLKEPLEKLYFEVYFSFNPDQKKITNFIEGTTLSLLC